MAESLRRLMFLMFALYFLQAMGGNPGLHIQALQKFLKEVWQFTPLQSSAFFNFLVIPWTIKPLYGILSDFLPIFGSRRKSYFLLTSALAAGSYGFLIWLGTSRELLYLLLFNAGLGLAFSDVLTDAFMVEKGQPLNATGRLQAWQWAAIFSAGILISTSKGYLADYFPLQATFKFSFVAPLLVFFLALTLVKEEQVLTSGQAARDAWVGLKQAIRSKSIWAAAIFIFLYNLSPNLGEAFYYYEKDTLKFSDTLIGLIDAAGSLTSLVGAILFNFIDKYLSRERMLRIIIIGGAIGTLLFLFFRGVVSGFIVSAIVGFVGVMVVLAILRIAAEVCPKNIEGTVFALLMSVFNIGTRFGITIGSALYPYVGYYWLVVISAAFTACMWFALPLVREKKLSKGA